MRVCIVTSNFLEPTAWMVSAYKTALMLKKAGHRVSVLTTRTKGSKPQETIEGVRVYRTPCRFIPDPFNYTIALNLKKHLLKVINKEKPDIFIISKYMFHANLAIFQLKKMKLPVILQTDTFPGINWFAPSKLLNIGMWIYARTLGRAVLNKADRVVLLHDGLIPVAKKLGLPHVVIHNGVDFKRYNNIKPAKDLINGKEVLVTYVGRLDEVKGYRLFLRMAERLHKQGVSARFLMVVGSKSPELRKKLSMKYPYIQFDKFRSDIPEVWAASDIGVLASYAEGLPNTVMEAMASGVPVVASNVGGVESLVINRETGLTIRPGDINALTRSVQELIIDEPLRKRLGKSAQKHIENEFDLDKIAKSWKLLFEQVLEHKRRVRLV